MKQVQQYIDQAQTLDWSGFDLWLYGGCISDWPFKDIDAWIIGSDRVRAAQMMYELQQQGPWDIYYTESEANVWNPGDQPVRAAAATTRDGKTLKWRTYKIPTLKHKIKMQHGYEYNAAIRVIQMRS